MVHHLADSRCGGLVSKHTTDTLLKMVKLVLTNSYFGFGQKMFHQISRAATGTIFAQPYASTFMDKFSFFKT